ncbi:MAG TPA: hypothetical protein VHM90_06200 [Phycisphaerae bacterium]|jgi:hypothetical protein|nr:hypothetical protein [Phycisphaerae bacterium]
MTTMWMRLLYFPVLAQTYGGFDDNGPATAPAAPRKPMSFSDLQQGMRDVHSGKVDDSGFRNGILIMLALIGLVALIMHFRQRKTEVVVPDSMGKLGRELSRLVHFPMGSRVFLKWVAKSTDTPFASLLLSESLFDRRIREWEAMPTFSAARHWGKSRLDRLRGELFGV